MTKETRVCACLKGRTKVLKYLRTVPDIRQLTIEQWNKRQDQVSHGEVVLFFSIAQKDLLFPCSCVFFSVSQRD